MARPDIDVALTRIERDLAEARKPRSETEEFVTEQRKPMAEPGKLERDCTFLPWTFDATLLDADAILFAADAGFIKLIGS